MLVYRRAGETCSPKHIVCFGEPKHQMRIRVSIFAAKVLLLRHHVTHRAWLRARKLFLIECGFDLVEHLSLGQPRQCQLCRLESEWQGGSYTRRVGAKGQALMR